MLPPRAPPLPRDVLLPMDGADGPMLPRLGILILDEGAGIDWRGAAGAWRIWGASMLGRETWGAGID